MKKAAIFFGVWFALAFKPVVIPFILNLRNAPVDMSVGTIPELSTEDLSEHYSGKSALVIGGTRGVGYGTALAMARAGASVTIVGRNATTGQTAVEKIRSLCNESKAEIDYLQGDIGTITTAHHLVDKLAVNTSRKYDFLVVTAAVFPKWDGELQQEDGLDTSFAIAVLGRYIIFKNMYKFLQNSEDAPPRVLSVLAGGKKPGASLDRDLVTGKRNVTSLFESIIFWVLAHDLMQVGLEERDAHARQTTRVITHPGILKTDLHRGQSPWFDVLEKVLVSLAGLSEEECGMRQASILVSDRLLDRSISFVDPFMTGHIRSEELNEQVDAHLDFLWSFLNRMANSRNNEIHREA